MPKPVHPKQIDTSKFTTITYDAEFNAGDSGASITIDLNDGQEQVVKLTAASVAISFTLPTAGVGNFRLRLLQDATGGRATTWSGTVTSPGTTANVAALTANQWTICSVSVINATDGVAIQIPMDASNNALPFTTA